MTRQLSLDDVRTLQKSILHEVDAFCRERHIRYYLWAGSLLGAVRHGGYIPWDDDIDVAMPRPDFERFCEEFARNGAGSLRIYDRNTHPTYGYPFARVADVRSILDERSRIAVPIGVNVDIFPMDGWPNGRFRTLLHRARLVLLRGLVAVWTAQPRPDRELVPRIIIQVTRPFLDRISIRTLTGMISRAAQAYPYEEAKYVGVQVWTAQERVERTAYGHPCPLHFEGRPYPGPEDPDRVLSAFYGDYMTLPPKSEQRLGRHFAGAYWME